MSLSQFDQFTALQNALSELNYSQPLLRESVPLVQAIFTDLIEVTKKYTQVRSKSAHSQRSLEAQLTAIKLENDKLTKSNNELHLKIIQSRDASQSDLRRLEKENESLKMARNELNVLLKQKKNKIKQQNITVNSLKKKMNAVLSAKGAIHKPLLSQTALLSANSPPSELASTDSVEASHSASNADLDLLRDENAALLSKVQTLERSADAAREERSALDAKLLARDAELRRIHSTLQIDDARIALIRHEQAQSASTQQITHLKSQIEVLQDEITAHEKDIAADKAKDAAITKLKAANADLQTALEDANDKSDALRRELIGVSNTADALKLEKAYDVTAGAKRVSAKFDAHRNAAQREQTLGARVKVLEAKLADKCKAHAMLQDRAKADVASKHALSVALETKERQILQLRDEQTSLRSICDELKQRIAALKIEMETNARERQSLAHKLSTAESTMERTTLEKDALSEEIAALSRKCAEQERAAVQSAQAMSSLKSRMDALGVDNARMEQKLVATLDKAGALEEADTLKHSENMALAQRFENLQFENDDLKKARQWHDSAQAMLQRKVSVLEQAKKAALLKAERVATNLEDVRSARAALQTQLEHATRRADEMESKLRQSVERSAAFARVEQELTRTQRSARETELELVRVTNELDAAKLAQQNLGASDARKSDAVRKLDTEKSALKVILTQMQQRMGAFQQRMTALTADRDQVKAKLDAAMAQCDAKNAQIESGALNASDLKSEHLKLQSALKDTTRRFQKLQAEHAAVMASQRESASQMAEIENARRSLEHDLHAQLDDKKALHAQIIALTRDNEALSNEVLTLKSEHAHLSQTRVPALQQEAVLREAKMGELKVLCSKLDDAQKATRAQLEELHNQKVALERRLEMEAAKCEEQARIVHCAQQHNVRLKAALSKLVSKHDEVQNALDVTAEQKMAFDVRLAEEAARHEQMQAMLGEAQTQLSTKHKEATAATQRAAQAEAALRKLEGEVVPRMCEEGRLKAEQLKAAQQDMMNMAKENQFLNAEYAETLKARDVATKRLSTALNEILVMESAGKAAKGEQSQILENYKSVVLENERLSRLGEMLERAKSELAVQVGVLQQHCARRDARLKTMEQHLASANVTNHELQRQNQTLGRDLERTQIHSTKNESERRNVERDLSALRSEVVAKQMADLERKNGIIVRFKRENKRLEGMVRELSLEKEVALKSLEGAQGKMKRLEGCIEKLRVDGISKVEKGRERSDEAEKMKMELNQIKDLNQRLNERLQNMQ